MRTPAFGHSSAPIAQRGDVERWSSARHLYLDNLKVVLIAAIIAAHAITSYATEAWWLYSDVRETTLSSATETALLAVAGPFGLIMIPLLFLVAGLLTPPSLDRKGTRRYVRDRVLRLGLPFAAFVLLWPALEYSVFRPFGGYTGSYWDRLLRTDEPLQSGPLWFVGALLVFALGYVGWARSGLPRTRRDRRIDAGHLFVLAVLVTVTTFLVRLDIPFDSDQYVALNLYQWPGSLALFALGIAASAKGWVAAVPDRLYRQSRFMTLATVVGFAVFTAVGAALDGLGEDTWTGGWHWDAAVFIGLESLLTVFGPVWMLGITQRHLNRPFRWARPAVARSAYGAFMLQGLMLVGIAVVLRPLPLPAEVKALMLATGAVAGSFALAWLVIHRIPGASRVL